MKRNLYSLFLLLMVITLFACSSDPMIETITGNPGNYIYSEAQTINILDIPTGDSIATLTVTGYETLLDKPFAIPRYIGSKENGEKVYEDIEYNLLVQINYRFENQTNFKKKIGTNNFSIVNVESNRFKINPDIEYTPIPHNGEQSFVIAFREKRKELHLDFTYDTHQSRATAKIHLVLE